MASKLLDAPDHRERGGYLPGLIALGDGPVSTSQGEQAGQDSERVISRIVRAMMASSWYNVDCAGHRGQVLGSGWGTDRL